MTDEELIRSGLEHHQANRLPEAEQAYRQVLSQNPNSADALHLLAVVAHQAKRPDAAVELVRRAVALSPRVDVYYSNMGVFLEALGRNDEAKLAYRRALELNPNYADALSNLGNLMRAPATLEEATSLCRRAIQIRPDYPEALNNLGNCLHDARRPDEAIALYHRALEVRPTYAQPHSNLGNAYKDKGMIDLAIYHCRKALELQPEYPDAMSNLGACLYEKGELHEAAAYCRQAIKLRPHYPEALNNLGTVLRELSQPDEAIECYRRFIALRQDMPAVYSNLGTALKDLGKITEALAAYERALTLKPDESPIRGNRLLTLHYQENPSPKEIFEDHKQWAKIHARPLSTKIRGWNNDPSPDRRLKIGFVSADLRRHSVAAFLLPIVKQKDPAQLHITCYSTTVREDDVTQDLRQSVDGWTNLMPVSDDAAAEKIREDGIDILVDLGGHTANNRLLIFARKPAPVQVTYLGYPNTTGMKAVDWRITDEKADPAGADELYTERLLRLPETAWCFHPLSGSPPVEPARRDHVVFGSFNDYAKINTPLVEMWAKILTQVPTARMLIKNRTTGSPTVRQRLKDELTGMGVSWDRVELLLPIFAHEQHLKHYDAMDIALDSFPYHGTTTTCEAMWMGVPVVSLAGNAHVSRVGVSLLGTVGLPELIAHDREEYIRLAVGLAQDRSRLAVLRSTLRDRMKASPLMDEVRFVRNLERGFRTMWQAWIKR